jgi:hypothetical protein
MLEWRLGRLTPSELILVELGGFAFDLSRFG